MKLTLRMLGLLAVAGATSAFGQQTILVDFDTASKWAAGGGALNAYQTNHVYTDSDVLFTGGPAMRNGTTAQDSAPGAVGSYSWRLRDGAEVDFAATYTADLAANEYFSGFSFDARRWDGSPSPAYTVSYSFDGGATWTTATSVGSSGVLNNAAFDNSSEWKSFSQSVMSSVGLAANQFVVRFSATGGERIMIDNFGLTTEVIPEPSAFAALAGVGALGLCALRRRRA